MCQPTSPPEEVKVSYLSNTKTKSPLKLFDELETKFLGMLHIGSPFFYKKNVRVSEINYVFTGFLIYKLFVIVIMLW
jgi:hypothetical protein